MVVGQNNLETPFRAKGSQVQYSQGSQEIRTLLVPSPGANNAKTSSLSSAEMIWAARGSFEGGGAAGERRLAPALRVYPKLPSLLPAVANHKQSDNSPLYPAQIV